MRRRWRWVIGIVESLLVLVGIGIGVLHQRSYAPSAAAERGAAQATITDYGLYFKPKHPLGPTVIVYPGALVAPASYSVWAKQVAAAGYPVAIVSFPLDLAVLNADAAKRVPVSHRGYVIGGHSLGGVMASRYARAHPKRLRGVFFLASYPDAKGRLDRRKTPGLSLTASRDGVLNRKQWRQGKRYLPRQTQFAQLDGGNHAGFGSYGAQRGDRRATVSTAHQQRWIAAELIRWLNKQTVR